MVSTAKLFGLSEKDISLLTGVTPAYINMIKSGKRKLHRDKIRKLEKLLQPGQQSGPLMPQHIERPWLKYSKQKELKSLQTEMLELASAIKDKRAEIIMTEGKSSLCLVMLEKTERFLAMSDHHSSGFYKMMDLRYQQLQMKYAKMTDSALAIQRMNLSLMEKRLEEIEKLLAEFS